MLIINKKFIERWSSEYDHRTWGTYHQTEEATILAWLSKQGKPEFLNKEYFTRLGRWKTLRWRRTRESNNEHEIIEATHSAYVAKNDLEKLNILRGLKGVGIAVASTILYCLEPDKFAIYDYHVRNSLRKAGKLVTGAKGSISKTWLEYTRVVRELSDLYSKPLREVEKALYAYDKWGCNISEPGAKRKKGKTEVNQRKNKKLLTQVEIMKRVDVIRDNSTRTLCHKCLTLLQQRGCYAVHCREDNISVHDKDGLLLRFCPSTVHFSVRYKAKNGELGRRNQILEMDNFSRILDDLRSWGRIAW